MPAPWIEPAVMPAEVSADMSNLPPALVMKRAAAGAGIEEIGQSLLVRGDGRATGGARLTELDRAVVDDVGGARRARMEEGGLRVVGDARAARSARILELQRPIVDDIDACRC